MISSICCNNCVLYIACQDPYLGATLTPYAIKGIQSKGVVTNAKHWVNNNQETNRGSISEVVDERTRYEMYYPPFEAAVTAGVGSVMCSYNRINGVYSCENNATLHRDLKERLGFKGWVMSDWGATHSLSINEGLDQEMPGDSWLSDDALTKAVQAGTVSQDQVDDRLVESVKLILLLQFCACDVRTALYLAEEVCLRLLLLVVVVAAVVVVVVECTCVIDSFRVSLFDWYLFFYGCVGFW